MRAPLLVVILAFLAVAACQHTSASIADASDASPVPNADAACERLRALGCPLGSSPKCSLTFRLDPKFSPPSVACVAGAASAAEVAAKCGIACPPPAPDGDGGR